MHPNFCITSWSEGNSEYRWLFLTASPACSASLAHASATGFEVAVPPESVITGATVNVWTCSSSRRTLPSNPATNHTALTNATVIVTALPMVLIASPDSATVIPGLRSAAVFCLPVSVIGVETPSGPKGERRSADVISNAAKVVCIATGEESATLPIDGGNDPAAKALGNQGRTARAKNLPPQRRAEIAKKAAEQCCAPKRRG